MRLLRNNSNGAVVDYNPSLASNSDFVELTEEQIRGYFAGQSGIVGKPVGSLSAKDGVVFHLSSAGIGDAVVGLYAACGVASAGYRTTYYARHSNWLGAIEHENLTVIPLPVTNQDVCGVDANQEYQKQLTAAYEGKLLSRAHWFASCLSTAYPDLPKDIAPARPQKIDRGEDPGLGSYILISPYATRPCRNWPAPNYARVASALMREGHKVIALVPKEYAHEANIMENSGAKTLINPSVKDARALVAYASLVIGGDSGMAHMAGLLGTKAIAIMAQAGVAYTFWCGDSVVGLLPSERILCRLCHWQPQAGCEPACGYFCAALGTISTYDVMDAARDALAKKGTITKSKRGANAGK